ncbi:helix-turn-helix domain-containing protein [Thalassobacillus sp. C254]|uniref:helix-turn-helix domain-containing protein n=1 Tax=Thalassobacillus sp. C254 TaxID=1225341 RepID=UPI0006D21D08|nr:helix-turn-helix domain-containing protein [Thalassobacillus sp. C254]
MDKSYYVSKDLAELLNITEATIYKYIREGKVIPYNKDSWQIDGEYRFSEEEALKLVDAQEEKPGLSTKDIADQLGITSYTVTRHIKSGELPAERKMYKGLERYFVKEEDFKVYASRILRNKQEKLYDETLGFYLFQPLYEQDGTLAARVLQLDELIIQSINGERLSLEEAKNLAPTKEKNSLFNGKKVRKPGYVAFTFPASDNVYSSTYYFMDYVMNEVGLQNALVQRNKSTISFSVRSFDLPIPAEDNPFTIEGIVNKYMTQALVCYVKIQFI